MAGHRGAPRPRYPSPKVGGWDRRWAAGPLGGQTQQGWANRRGSRRLCSPGRACPATRTNRSHSQGESSSVRLLSLPLLTAPEPMARRGGRAGAVKPSPSHYLCTPSSPRVSEPEPASFLP